MRHRILSSVYIYILALTNSSVPRRAGQDGRMWLERGISEQWQILFNPPPLQLTLEN